MDNRELDLAIPETRIQSQADGVGLNAEEGDVSLLPPLTVEYVTYFPS